MQPTDIAELRRLWEAGQEPNKHWADNLYRIYSAIPALRAELAKEKANASLVGTWEQAARKAAGEDGVQFVGPNTIFAVSDKLRAERDTLRAELAAAQNLLARIHRDGGHHTEAVGFAQSVADADLKVSEWLLAAEERTALAAHVERMEKACKAVAEYDGAWGCDCDGCEKSRGVVLDQCADALAATPTQSLAAHDADVKVAVLRKFADRIGLEYGEPQAAWCLRSEADRIEKEAPHA